jgi:hypothetical protein
VFAVNPFLVQYGGSIATETPFALLLVLSVASLSKDGDARWRLVFAGAASIAAALTRLAGIPILAALWVHWLLDRRWKRLAVFTLASAATVGVWLLWAAAGDEQFMGQSYLASVTSPGAWEAGPWGLVRRFVRKGANYIGVLLPYVLPVPTVGGTPIDNGVAAVLITAGLLAGVVILWRRWRVACLALLSYAVMLLIWPWRTERFIVPMLVLIVPALVVGLGWFGRLASRRAELAVVIAAMSIIGATGAVRTGHLVRQRMGCDRNGPMPPPACVRLDERSYFEAIRYIQGSTPEDAIFLSLKPEPLYLYTGRRSVGARRALAQADTDFIDHLRGTRTEYILLGSLQGSEPGRLAGLLQTNCDALELVAFFPARTYLFRVRDAGQNSDGRACDAVRRYRIANANRDFLRDP